MSAMELDVRDAEEVFVLLDIHAEGALSISTLMDGFTRLKGGAKSIDIVQTMEMIRRLDKDVATARRCLVRDTDGPTKIQIHKACRYTSDWSL